MDIHGKKVSFLGDSITEGCGASEYKKCYVALFQSAYPDATIANYGVGGTRIARQHGANPDYKNDHDFMERAEAMQKNADLVVVFGGTNDYGHGNAKLGDFGDSDPYTFYGATNILFEQLIKDNPHAKILILTPLHRLNEKNANQNGYVLEDYVKALREMAEEFSFPVLDLFKNSGMNPAKGTIQVDYMPDGLHPNDAGYRRLFEQIDLYIKTNL